MPLWIAADMGESTAAVGGEAMTEVFEIPPGRCREEKWTASARVQCAHLDGGYCRVASRFEQWRLAKDEHFEPVRRTDGKCPYGDGCIRVTQEAG